MPVADRVLTINMKSTIVLIPQPPLGLRKRFPGDLAIQERLRPAVAFFHQFSLRVGEHAGIVDLRMQQLGRKADVVARLGALQEAHEAARPHLAEVIDILPALAVADIHLYASRIPDAPMDGAQI